MLLHKEINLFKVISDLAITLQSHSDDTHYVYEIGEFKSYHIIFEKSGNISKIVLENKKDRLYIYNDGSALLRKHKGSLECNVPLILIYIAIHILQIFNNKTMTNKYNIDSMLPKDIDKERFWFGEYQYQELDEIMIDVCNMTDPIEPGIYTSFGITLPFEDGIKKLQTIKHFTKDENVPFVIIKTPDGVMETKHIFQLEQENYHVQKFFANLYYYMIMCKDHSQKYTNVLPIGQFNIKNPMFAAKSYIMYTTLNDITLDKATKKFDCKWTVISSE